MAYDETEMRTRQKRIVTPGEPQGVKQHHRNTGAKENHQLKKVEFSTLVNIRRMDDCIVGLRLIALTLLFLSIFLSFPILRVYIEIFVRVFSCSIKDNFLKLSTNTDAKL